MAEAPSDPNQRDIARLTHLLHGVSEVITRLNRKGSQSSEEISNLLAVLGEAAEVDRVYVFENSRDESTGTVVMNQRFEWARNEVTVQLDNPDLQNLPYDLVPSEWLATLQRGECYTLLAEEGEGWFREELERQEILSLLAAPIELNGKLWGFVGFDDCRVARRWSEVEASALSALAGALGAAIARQRTEELVHALSAPIAEVWQGILSLPIMGVLDAERAARITEEMLESVTRLKARIVLLDLTGIEAVDTATSSNLVRMAKATRLLGAECYLTGLTPTVARALVHLGVDLESLRTFRTLRDGLKAALDTLATGPTHAINGRP